MKTTNVKKRLVNPIDEYLKSRDESHKARISRELFNATPDDIDLKTELSSDEVKDITSLMYMDDYLRRHGLKPVFKTYYQLFMRLMISKDRKSRGEFVNVNSEEKTGDLLERAGNLGNMLSPRQ